MTVTRVSAGILQTTGPLGGYEAKKGALYHRQVTYLGLLSAFKVGICLANQVEIFVVENFFLLALSSSSLLTPTPFARLGVLSILLILVNDEAFSNLL